MSAPAEPLSAAKSRPRPGRLLRAWRALRFRDAVVLTLLPLVAAVLLVGDAVRRYGEWSQFRDWWSARADVSAFVSHRVDALRSLPDRVALRQGFDPDAPDPGIIRLDVPRRTWDSLQGDPLALWGEWVEASLRYGGANLQVRVRKRGDNSIHWLTDKRTLTVRTRRSEFYKRYRTFGLSVKDVIPSYLANRLAAEFDLLSTATAVVPVFLNNQFYGTFRFIEVVDESFLRPFNRMPGNIFRGDAAQRGDYFKGVQRNLFSNPYIWDRVAVNDRWTSAGPDQLRLLLADLRGGTFADHQRLMARIDTREYARLFAYYLVVGDPYHTDGVHNQFHYEDPSTQLLHPIPWDLRLRDLNRREGRLNDLYRAVLRDPLLVDGIMREVDRAIGERGIEAVAESLLVDVDRRYHDYLEFDRLRTGLVPDVGTVSASLGLLRANIQILRGWLNADTVAVAAAVDGRIQILDVQTRGLVGVDLHALEGVGDGRTISVFRDRNRNGVLDRDDPEVAGRIAAGVFAFDTPIGLLAGWSTERRGIDPGPIPYRLFVTGAGDSALTPRLANRITGRAPTVEHWEVGEAIDAPLGWHPWRYPETRPRVHRYAGDVALAQTVLIPAGDTVVVAPGTTFRVGPDVSVISRGVVQMTGTDARPIRFVPADSGRPWGTFSLVGPGATGSQVRHAEFVGGGGGLVDRIEYIGMVNVHRARGVVFDSVLFLRNVRSDDTFHALHADVVLSNSRFVDANSDAVDFDISTGEIRNNVFDGSGGDAIDLMTSDPRIVGNVIRRPGDKGISVGEASAPLIFGNLIEDAPTGIEIKDRSAPTILNNDIRRTDVGLRSRVKNWRYGGSGFGFIANTNFDHATTGLEADSLSRLTAVGVRGLDSTSAGGPVPLTWLYGRLGLAMDSATVGRAGWREIRPRPPLDEIRFVDDFRSVADGWIRGPRVVRLEKRRDVLVVEAEGGPGEVGRVVRWDLGPDTGGVLVMELAGRDVAKVTIVVEGDRRTTSQETTLPADPTRFGLTEVRLPAGRYEKISLTVEPTPGLSHIQRKTGLSVVRAGRLFVRSVAVYPDADRAR